MLFVLLHSFRFPPTLRDAFTLADNGRRPEDGGRRTEDGGRRPEEGIERDEQKAHKVQFVSLFSFVK